MKIEENLAVRFLPAEDVLVHSAFDVTQLTCSVPLHGIIFYSVVPTSDSD